MADHSAPASQAEPEALWLGSRRFWLLCVLALLIAALGVSARSWQLSSRTADPIELHLYGQPHLVPGLPATFRVLVSNGQAERPLPGASVAVALIGAGQHRTELGAGTSDADGLVVIRSQLPPELPEGDYQLHASARSPLGSAEASHGVTIARTVRILLTTDKPLYQPGQVMHLRALALSTADQHPAAGSDLTFEVQDAKGNKVFKQRVRTSPYGIAAADFALADQVNAGDYSLSAMLGGATAQRSVSVRTYTLPKFRVELSTDRASYQPGGTIQGELRATYTFGQPVAGAQVHLTADEFIERFHTFATLDGTTDATGLYRFTIKLDQALIGQELTGGGAIVKLDAQITAKAGGEQHKTLDVNVTSQPLRVELVPESGELLRGVPNRIYVVTSTPEGRPVSARVTAGIGGASQSVETSRLGVGHLEVTPDATASEVALTLTAVDPTGARSELVRKLPIGVQPDGVLLRPDRAVYRVGDEVRLELFATGPTGRVFIDVVKEHRTVMMHAVDVKSGRGSVTFALPADLAGTLQLCAYSLRGDGDIVRDVRLIQVHGRDQLRVSVQSAKPQYAPGETAVLDFAVSRADGSPAPAALGIVGVDEAVYALYDMRPGLEQLYFTLQEELLKPRYEIHAHLPQPLPPSSLQDPKLPKDPKTGDSELDEAQRVLLIAAAKLAATEAWAGALFRERQVALNLAARAWMRQVQTVCALLPLQAFFLLFLVVFGYAVVRLFPRHRLPTRLTYEPEDAAQAELQQATGSLNRRWLLGIFLPWVALLLSELLGSELRLNHQERMSCDMLGLSLSIVVAALLLFRAASRIRAAAASQPLPLLRKVVLTVPYAYLCASLGCVVATLASREGLMREDDSLGACLVAFLLAGCYLGFLAAARQSLIRPVGLWRWLWLVFSRPVGMLLPLLAVWIFSVGGARKAAPVFEREEMMPMPMTPSAAPMPADSAPTGSAPVKEPERVRRHFPETLLWRPEILTDGAGRAHLEVPLADSITTWRIDASAVSATGELGAATLGLPVFQDFFVDIEFPPTLTQHDEVSVPVSVFNYLDKPQTVRLTLEAGRDPWLQAMGPAVRSLTLGAKQTTTVLFRVRVLTPGRHTLTVKAAGSVLADAVERPVTVIPDGVPVTETVNGRLEPQLTREVAIPAGAIPGGSDLYLKLYPGAFSQVVEGLDGIFQMPSGCFEQTSSTTYPSVLALDYLRRTGKTKPDLELKALSYIGLGYQRLLSFEVPGGGFEWFGHAPAHNILTAYGVLEFHDMAKVYAVDPAVIARTRRWLWDQARSGRFTPTSGGIAEGAINQYQGGEARATAYIGWALAESQEGGADSGRLAPVMDTIAASADDSDPYSIALAAQALLAGGRGAQAGVLLDRLEKLAVRDRESLHWTSKAQGVTYSLGDSLDIETTGLAAQALLRSGGHVETAHRALTWLIARKSPGGTWGSTQSTLAAMRALLAGTAGGGVEGEVRVAPTVNGQPLPEVVITPETSEVLRLVSLRPQVRPGKNTLSLTTRGKGELAFQLVAVHYLPWSQAGTKPEPEPMNISVRYDHTTVKQDQLLPVHVSVRWNGAGAADMTLVDLGVPPGFDLLGEDLDDLVARGTIQRWSRTGRQLIVYLTRVTDKPTELTYRLRARYPIRAKTPSSRAYPYYQPEATGKSPPVELTVQ